MKPRRLGNALYQSHQLAERANIGRAKVRTARRCKRDMAWSEDAGRERTKAWMQASDEGNGLGLRSWTASEAMAKATVLELKRGAERPQGSLKSIGEPNLLCTRD
jgi:hypothetical protein